MWNKIKDSLQLGNNGAQEYKEPLLRNQNYNINSPSINRSFNNNRDLNNGSSSNYNINSDHSDNDYDIEQDALDDLERGPDDEEDEGKDTPLPALSYQPTDNKTIKNNKNLRNISYNDSTITAQELEPLFLSKQEDEEEKEEKAREDKKQKRAFWNSMIIVLLCLFIAEASRGMVTPSLWLFIKQVRSSLPYKSPPLISIRSVVLFPFLFTSSSSSTSTSTIQ